MMKKITAVVCAIALAVCQLPFSPAMQAKASGEMLPAVRDLTQRQTNIIANAMLDGIKAHEKDIYFELNERDRIPDTTENRYSILYILNTIVTQNEEAILTRKNRVEDIHYEKAEGSDAEYITGATIYYLVEDDVYQSEYDRAIRELDRLSADVQKNWSAMEKALFLHDHICDLYDYDTECDDEDPLCFTAYGLMTRGKAVCEGYAWLYNVLLNRMNINAIECESDTEQHIWNLVQVKRGSHSKDGEWAYVDVTNDDSFSGHPGFVSHSRFLRSEHGLRQAGQKGHDWILTTGESPSEYRITEKYDSGFWSKSRNSVQPYQDGWLVLDQYTEPDKLDDPTAPYISTGYLRYYHRMQNTYLADEVTSLSELWKGKQHGATEIIYKGSYITPVVDHSCGSDCIFYTMPDDIRAIYNNGYYTICNLTEEQRRNGHIYGMYCDGSKLHYYISSAPNTAPIEYTLDLSDAYRQISADLVPVTRPATEAPTTQPTTEPPTVTEAPTEPTTVTEAPTEPTTVTQDPTAPTTVTQDPTEPTTETQDPTEPTTVTEEPTEPVTETAAPTEPFTGSPVKKYAYQSATPVRGDVDQNGVLNVLDLIIVTRYLHGSRTLSAVEMRIADVSQDGVVDVFDLGYMKQLMLQ